MNAESTSSPPVRWEHFPHGADIGVRGFGGTMAEAFEAAAIAAIAIVTPPDKVKPDEKVGFDVTGADPELLLVNWLNALIFEMAARSMVFGKFSVRINGLHLTGEAAGEPIDAERHEPAVEMKGATLTMVKVMQTPGGEWIAQCVVDV